MAVNKVEINNADGSKQTLIDLTNDTVTSKTVVKGVTAHAADGSIITGSYNLPSFSVNEDTNTFIIVYDGTDLVIS